LCSPKKARALAQKLISQGEYSCGRLTRNAKGEETIASGLAALHHETHFSYMVTPNCTRRFYRQAELHLE